jgi:hypothetical protein
VLTELGDCDWVWHPIVRAHSLCGWYNINLRGVGNIIDRGTGTVVLNSEYRHTFFEKINWLSKAIYL